MLLAAVTVTLAPLAESVPLPMPLLPTLMLPRLRVAGLTVSWPTAARPVPDSDSVVVEGCALLVKVRVAVADPVDCGVKVTVKGTVWPEGMVTGSDSPLMLNTELLVLAAVTVTLAPLAESVPLPVPLLPTVTLPRLSEAGLTDN